MSPKTAKVKEGEDVQLKCIVTCARPSSIEGYKWYKEEGNTLHEEETYRINMINRSHGGNYHCKAKNSAGWSRLPATAEVDVQCK